MALDELRNCSTQTLLQAARSGSQDALEVLCDRYIDRLEKWAHRRLPLHARDLKETKDIIQEAIVNSLRQLPAIESAEGFFQYMKTSVKNLVLNAIRDSSRRKTDTGLDEALVDSGPSPIEVAIGKEKLARYERALEKLHADQRELVIARIEMEMSWAEIAIDYGFNSADAARVATSRIIKKLAVLIGEEGPL